MESLFAEILEYFDNLLRKISKVRIDIEERERIINIQKYILESYSLKVLETIKVEILFYLNIVYILKERINYAKIC